MQRKQRVRQQRHRLRVQRQVLQKRQQLEPKRGQEPVRAPVPVPVLLVVGGEAQFQQEASDRKQPRP